MIADIFYLEIGVFKKILSSCDPGIENIFMGSKSGFSLKGPDKFEVLPDFDELEEFHGISDPANFRLIKKRVKEQGLTESWKRYVEATGELSRLAYREEVEAVMRTAGMSGITLLGLQDFPGQGTALVGMLNYHLQPKPYEFAKPEHFRSFFRDQLPLVLLSQYTWENTEEITIWIQIDLCQSRQWRWRHWRRLFRNNNRKFLAIFMKK